MLAALQVGRTYWGFLYLTLSMFATVIQIMLLLPYLVMPAVPFIIAFIAEIVSLSKARKVSSPHPGGGSSNRSDYSCSTAD